MKIKYKQALMAKEIFNSYLYVFKNFYLEDNKNLDLEKLEHQAEISWLEDVLNKIQELAFYNITLKKVKKSYDGKILPTGPELHKEYQLLKGAVLSLAFECFVTTLYIYDENEEIIGISVSTSLPKTKDIIYRKFDLKKGFVKVEELLSKKIEIHEPKGSITLTEEYFKEVREQVIEVNENFHIDYYKN